MEHIEASHHVEAVLEADLDEVVAALVILPVHVLWGVSNVYGYLLRKGLRLLLRSQMAESHHDAACSVTDGHGLVVRVFLLE